MRSHMLETPEASLETCDFINVYGSIYPSLQVASLRCRGTDYQRGLQKFGMS